MYPVLSCMVMDIISVQSTLGASESAFSTTERVLSIRRTRLTPASLEMYFKEEILDAEVLQNEAIPLSEEEIALDVASSEGTMIGRQVVNVSSIMVVKRKNQKAAAKKAAGGDADEDDEE
ncbi:zinc finger BED domain-containing protein RICESLEEPER 2-like protein [Tanacetum coccineum]